MEKYTIYQITCINEEVKETYIGSTVNLKNRIRVHKSDCNNPNSVRHNLKVYKFIRNNGGWKNFKFVILETKECKDEYESYVIEQSYITDLKSELNSQSSYTGLTKQEYNKQYRQENQEYFKQYDKQYNILNKEKIKEKDKQKYQKNKEKLKEKSNQYRQENKNKLNEKYCCLICKGSYTYKHIIQHEQTQKHINHIL